ncbi:hypothetical protein MVEN_01438100 [Mycena venus]|uniref:Uncharacterized protein n=1 Tax=Mycena venus TaxID=2733690 RepID=A0A8H6XVV6_9AGAR|nr:hypothetical protein MVEN_01438100 [Mycena venus]
MISLPHPDASSLGRDDSATQHRAQHVAYRCGAKHGCCSDTGGTDGALPMQPDMFDDIVVEPPPAPPASTPGSAPVPPPPPPATTSRTSKGKLCAPHPKHFTARNLHLAVYCVDDPCSEAEYKVEWSRLQSEDAGHIKVYEKYANTLKNSKPKPTEIPTATVICKCIEELSAKQTI